ncbi:MAG TPA: hypothetical protein VFQ53_07485 [Kofleriaceae bacterium]|nr:hypothetical protein [Kofleriaceae bacterium]
MTDFAALSRAARELPGPDTHDRLWRAWFELSHWHFLKSASPIGILPASGFVYNQRCVLAFTSVERADGYAKMTHHPDRIAPVLSVIPEVAVQLVPRLQMYGVLGLVVEPGPDNFYTPIVALFAMLQRYRPRPVPVAPRVPAPPPPPRAPVPAPMTAERLLALPAWHVVTSQADPNVPALADRGSDLIAQIYTAPRPSTTPMPPPRALSLFVDMELVRFVRFDDQLEIELVDLALPRS